ncbi:MAG: flagellar assembly peptidoglycan hydrolase FlgJ [Pseudomonadales bacterium]|nr:flagellar assembly peptidoglycan hydrolase FlgJ [Pseudomonadales bacterium]
MSGPMATDVSYAQFAQLPHILNKETNSPEGLQKAAQHFESLFIDMWLKAARQANESIASDNFMNTNEMKMHQQMMDHEMSIHLSKHGGVGLADVIVRQLQGQAPLPTEGALTPQLSNSVEAQKPQPLPTSQRVSAFSDPDAFIQTIQPIVEKLLKNTSLPIEGVLGQAALETGWGNNVIAKEDGSLSHNLFGMKAKTDAEPSVPISSMEFELGKWVNKLANFRSYPDWEGSVQDYIQTLSSNPRYQDVMAAGDDLKKFASTLMQTGYATDPKYADKLVSIAERITKGVM